MRHEINFLNIFRRRKDNASQISSEPTRRIAQRSLRFNHYPPIIRTAQRRFHCLLPKRQPIPRRRLPLDNRAARTCNRLRSRFSGIRTRCSLPRSSTHFGQCHHVLPQKSYQNPHVPLHLLSPHRRTAPHRPQPLTKSSLASALPLSKRAQLFFELCRELNPTLTARCSKAAPYCRLTRAAQPRQYQTSSPIPRFHQKLLQELMERRMARVFVNGPKLQSVVPADRRPHHAPMDP